MPSGWQVSLGADSAVGGALGGEPQGSSWVETEHGRKRRSRMRCELRTAPGRRFLSEGRGGFPWGQTRETERATQEKEREV